MNGIEAVQILKAMGYRLKVDGEAVCYEWQGAGKPNPSQVRPLLEVVKAHKAEAISYLAQKQEAPERILTCFGCGYFRPSATSPNDPSLGALPEAEKRQVRCGDGLRSYFK